MQERISRALDWWLREEVQQSHQGRNKILDDFKLARDSYVLPMDDPQNLDAGKINGHFMQFKQLMSIVEGPEELRNDRITGKILHHILRFTSGSFRGQCFLQADGQARYEELRFAQDRATSIDIASPVAQAIESANSRSIPELIRQSNQVGLAVLDSRRKTYAWFADNPQMTYEALPHDAEPVTAMVEAQRLTIGLAASHVLVAAELRGSLAAVPFLEPKSISDVAPDPIYPIAA